MKTLVYNLNDEFFDKIGLKIIIKELLSTLTPQEEKVLRLRFGLDDGGARTLKEIGEEFNVTRERIRQIEAKALRKLRHPKRTQKFQDSYPEKKQNKTVIQLTEEGEQWIARLKKYNGFIYTETINNELYFFTEKYNSRKKVPQHLWYITEII